jgi:small subunit ribosomal protein S8
VEKMGDTLNEALIKIKNAAKLGKPYVEVRTSNLVGNVLKVFQKYGYIEEFEFNENGKGGIFRVKLAKTINDCGIIVPRFSIKKDEIEKWEARYLPAQDIGIIVMTTTEGVISDIEAKSKGLGGRALAYIY